MGMRALSFVIKIPRKAHQTDNQRSRALTPEPLYDGRVPSVSPATHLEVECLVEDRIEGLAVHFGLVFLLLVRQEINLDVRVGRARHVQPRQVFRLDHSHGKLQQVT